MAANGKIQRKAVVDQKICVACGTCVKVCPKGAVSIWRGCFAAVDAARCVGCGKCAKTCPADCISIEGGRV